MSAAQSLRRGRGPVCLGLGLLALLVSSPFLALGQVGQLCDDCQQCPTDASQWCATCRRVCGEKTTTKWLYGCREKTYCQHRTPCPFQAEECLECECAPRTRRVLIKKAVKQPKPVWKCEVDDPVRARTEAPRETAPPPPAPAADPAPSPKRQTPESQPTSPRPPAPRTASSNSAATPTARSRPQLPPKPQ